jgi:quinol-cytochrome oxidoreductase complex cytochrome b subunit
MGNQSKIRGQALGLLSMLAIQFILGMILNLYVKLPKVHPGTTGNFFSRAVHSFGWAVTNGAGIALLLHVIIAAGLLLGSLTLVFRAAAARSKPWLAVSIVGALAIITALTNGLAFIGYDNDTASFIMAIGFITATVAYTTGLAYSVMQLPAKSQPAKAKLSSRPTQRRHRHSYV